MSRLLSPALVRVAISSVLAAIVLMGCGGGGGGSEPSSNSPPPSSNPGPNSPTTPVPPPTNPPPTQPDPQTPTSPPSGPSTPPAPTIAAGRFLDLGAGTVGDIVSDPARHRLYASLTMRDELVVLSADTYLIERRFFVGARPTGMDMSADGTKLYVALGFGGSIAIVDLVSNAVSTIEVATELGTYLLRDVLEVRPGVVLASGYRPPSADAFLVTVDTNDHNSVRRVAGGAVIRGAAQLRLSADGKVVYVSNDEVASTDELIRLDNTQATLPILARTVAIDWIQRFVDNSAGNRFITGSGQVFDSQSLETLLSGTGFLGVIGARSDRSTMMRVTGDAVLMDGTTFADVTAFRVGCLEPGRSVERVVSVGLRDEWLFVLGAGDLCVMSTTSPSSSPGLAGSRALPSIWEPIQWTPAIETPVQKFSSDIVLDLPRDLIYVSNYADSELVFIDATAGGVVHTMPMPGKPNRLVLSADGVHLMVGLDDQGSVVVVDVQARQIIRTIDLTALLGRARVGAMVEVQPGRLFVGANITEWAAPYTYAVEVDPANPASAHRVGDPQGYCGPFFGVSRDKHYLYLSTPGCKGAMEKRDLNTPDLALVGISDPADEFIPAFMAESADGSRLYLPNGRIVNANTLRQVGQIPASGIPFLSTDGLRIHFVSSDASMATYELSTQKMLSRVAGLCDSAQVSPGNSGAWLMWPDFSRYAVLGLGQIFGAQGGVCVIESEP